jgi:hypothetical protein
MCSTKICLFLNAGVFPALILGTENHHLLMINPSMMELDSRDFLDFTGVCPDLLLL